MAFSGLGLNRLAFYPSAMTRLEGVTAKTAIVLLGAFIVVGGFAVALISNNVFVQYGTFGSFSPSAGSYPLYPSDATNAVGGVSGTGDGATNFFGGQTQLVQSLTTISTTTSYPGTTIVKGTGSGSTGGPPSTNVTSGTGSLIKFSSDVSISSATPPEVASGVVGFAYSVGGYVAYQATYKDSAYIVIRVPALNYNSVLTKIEAMGNVTSLVSNSNDVRVLYTDLNATLASLRTEQGALLRLLNQSTTVNSTLAIETQLQGVDQQINEVQSQILQTKTLIEYSTISVTVSKSAAKTPLSMTLSATPTNGTAPLSVTFNAIVNGGAQPYLINYNFGDGSAYQGQILVHTFYESGTYKVTVATTDQNGDVTMATTSIHVEAAPKRYGVGNFPSTIANLFVNVVEGIAEVAVVVLPLAAVGAVVVIPLRRRSRAQKAIKPSQ